MNKRIKKKQREICDFCSKKEQTCEIYTDLQICESCLDHNNRIGAISDSIEG